MFLCNLPAGKGVAYSLFADFVSEKFARTIENFVNFARIVRPNAKSRFWSKKYVYRKFKFWSEKKDLEVFDIADFKFLGPKSKFERNWRKRFWNFRKQFPGQKFQIENEIQVLRSRFFNFGDDFEFLCPKFKIEIEFEVQIFHFPETQFWKNRNFKTWRSRFLHFHSILTQIF